MVQVPAWRDVIQSFGRGERSPLDVLEGCLVAIEARNGTLNALVHVDADGARAAARASAARWQSGAPVSSIDGMPVAVKANVAVRGMPWTAALSALGGRIAVDDAAVVAELRARGAIILGIANMHEAALGATTTSPLYGQCRNPLDETCTPGGSSGGSAAAVAAGFCWAAIGTDTMGSVRLPSAYCGIAGIKPTAGYLPLAGVEMLSPSLDHVGFHARRVADLALLLEARPTGVDAAVFIDAGIELPENLTRALLGARQALEAAGLSCSTSSLGALDLSAMRRQGLLLCEAEFAALQGEGLAGVLAQASPGFRDLVTWGMGQPASRVARARQAMGQADLLMRRVLGQAMVGVMATAPHSAFPVGEAVPSNQPDLTLLANFAGVPSVTVRGGADGRGLPYGIQVLAPRGQDGMALAAAEIIEKQFS